MALATNPLVPLALTPPPISAAQWSLLFPSCPPDPISLSLRSASPGARLLAAVAANEPELGGGRSEGGGEGPGSGGGGSESDPQGGGEEGEEKMAEGLSMSQKLTLAYAALVGGEKRWHQRTMLDKLRLLHGEYCVVDVYRSPI